MVFITMHKAGSVFVNGVIRDILTGLGLVHIDFAKTAFRKSAFEADYCIERSPLLSMPGYYFGAFRGPYVESFADLSKNRLVVQVRDPRDCIVSLYFSFRYSHPLPGEGELRDRLKHIRSETSAKAIDSFAMDQVRNQAKGMTVIRKVLEHYPETLLLKYEEMVLDFDAWFQKLREFLGVPMSQDDINRYKTAVLPCHEDVNKHKRQVLPGDFRRKLEIETQEAVTRGLQVHLERFGYLDFGVDREMKDYGDPS